MPVPQVRSENIDSPERRGPAQRGPAQRGPAGGWLAIILVALLSCGAPRAVAASRRPPAKADRSARQWIELPLDSLGFPGISETFLRIGSSMLTVHFLDDNHLLVTFSLRDLVPRVAGDPASDEDRLVAAEVVNLPSGKIAARTVWHLHDHGRYLWSLGEGRFLVRIGERLSTMVPLANLESSDPFRRTAIPDQEYPPHAVFVSPDGELITTETEVSYKNPDGRAAALLGDVNADKPVDRTIIQFFRVKQPTRGSAAGSRETALDVVPAGQVTAREPVLLPLDSDGYLGVEEAGRNLWSMSFDEFGGKTIGLGKLQSTCVPRLQMVSRGEFVAFPCRGSDPGTTIVSYGLDGRETWEEGMSDLSRPVFAFAPAAARFAFSRTTDAPQAGSPGAEQPPGRQEVRVYQNASGDLLLRVDCSPVYKSAENFDLSSDGLLAAVVRNGAIAVYKLPPPRKEDMEDMAEVAKFTPPSGSGAVSLEALARRVEREKAADEERVSVAAARATAGAAPGAAGAAPAAAGPTVPASASAAPAAIRSQGDAANAAPLAAPATRRAPTLLNPGEKPEFGSGNAQPSDKPEQPDQPDQQD